MAAPESNIGDLIETAIANGVAAALVGVQIGTEFPVGVAPIAGQVEAATMGGSIAQSQYDAAIAIWTDEHHSPGWGSDLLDKVLAFTQSAGEKVVSSIGWGAESLVNVPFNLMTNEGPATPDKAMGNMGTAFGVTTVAGLLATVLADIPSLDVLGCGSIDFRGISAFIAKMGGWDQIYGQVWAPLMRGYVGQPMRYYINERLRPFRPGLMDIARLRYKRILPGSVHPDTLGPEPMAESAGGKMPGFEQFKQELAYQGYTDEWINVWEDDLYTEPRHFELQIMGENPSIPAAWWWKKCRRMGYVEQDVAYMAEGIQRKLAGAYIAALISQVTNAYRDGVMSDSDLEQTISTAGISDMAQDYAKQTAELAKYQRAVKEEGDLAVARFDRDQLTIEELKAQLDLHYNDPDTVGRMVDIATIKRYRRVYWVTDQESARAALATWRRLFIEGRISQWEYESAAIEAGVEPIAFDAMIALDFFRRDKSIAAAFQKYGLPKLRDQVLHGMLSIDNYRRELIAGGFPDEYIELELELMRTRISDRLAARIRADELPNYEAAYVIGLVGRDTLRSVMRAAGVDSYGIDAKMLKLDYEADQFDAKRDAAIAKADDREKAEAKRSAESRARWLDQQRARARGLSSTWAAEKSAEAKESTRTLAAELIAEAHKGSGADPARLSALSDQLADALWWAKVSAA